MTVIRKRANERAYSHFGLRAVTEWVPLVGEVRGESPIRSRLIVRKSI